MIRVDLCSLGLILTSHCLRTTPKTRDKLYMLGLQLGESMRWWLLLGFAVRGGCLGIHLRIT
ncbi:MAG: hypothetical protein HZB26_18760 [Candidatus Hydrogenedentes bacterium]|nr:hypothetical protein [Candidatus Hydrogenedentota bacterium]